MRALIWYFMVTKARAHQQLEEMARQWRPILPLENRVESNISRSQVAEFLQVVFQTFDSGRMIKPGRFASEEVKTGIIQWQFFDTFRGDYSPLRAEQLGIELRYDTYNEEDRSYLTYIHPTRPRVKTLVHDGLLWDERRLVPSDIDAGRYLEYFHNLIEKGVFGNPEQDEVTYLKKASFKSVEIKCGASRNNGPTIRLFIDTNKLLSMRDVYYDPEAAIVLEEFKNTFMVRGGIPFQAIKDFSLDPIYFK